MICPNCGANNAPGAKFCVGCGGSLVAAQQNAQQIPNQQIPKQQIPVQQSSQQYVPQQPVAEAPKAKKASKVNGGEVKARLASVLSPIGAKLKPLFSNKGLVFGVLGAIAAILVLVIICGIIGGNNGFIKQKADISVTKTDKDEYSIIVDKKVLSTKIESTSEPTMQTSIDGKYAAIVSSKGELFTVSGKKVKEIADDVSSFKISSNGKYVAYVTSEKKDAKTVNTLFLAKVSNGKSTEISDEISGTSYVISPNGKSVAYFAQAEAGKKAELMLFKGKKSEEIDDNGGTLLGMSDNGKQIYVSVTDEGKTNLYAYKKNGDKEKLGEYSKLLHFNAKQTQVMFVGKEGKVYISTKGKSGEKVSNDSISYLVTPYGYNGQETVLPIENLYKKVYMNSDNELWMLKKNDKSVKLVSKASSAQLDASGKYVYYVYNSEDLRCIKASHGDKASEKYKTIVDGDASSAYVVTSDRKLVYFLDGDTLCSVNGKKGGKAKEVADDVSILSGLALSGKDRVYYVMDGDLYCCSNGKKGSKIVSDIMFVGGSARGNVYAFSDDAIYGSTGAKKLKKICDIE